MWPRPRRWHSNLAHSRAVMDAILTGKPYPVTAAITLANNLMLALPNTKKVFKALQALQLCMVMEYYMTPSAAMADYVFRHRPRLNSLRCGLPAASAWPARKGSNPLKSVAAVSICIAASVSGLVRKNSGPGKQWKRSTTTAWSRSDSHSGNWLNGTASSDSGNTAATKVRVRDPVGQSGAEILHFRKAGRGSAPGLSGTAVESEEQGPRTCRSVSARPDHGQPFHAHVSLRAAPD